MRLTRPFPFAFGTTSRAQAIGSRSLRCGCNMRPCRGQWAEAAARACLRGVTLESTLDSAIRKNVECASPAHVRQGGRLVGSTSNPALDGVVDLWVNCVSPPAAFPSALSPAPAAFIDNVLLGHGRPRLMDGRITPGVGCGISFVGKGVKRRKRWLRRMRRSRQFPSHRSRRDPCRRKTSWKLPTRPTACG